MTSVASSAFGFGRPNTTLRPVVGGLLTKASGLTSDLRSGSNQLNRFSTKRFSEPNACTNEQRLVTLQPSARQEITMAYEYWYQARVLYRECYAMV